MVDEPLYEKTIEQLREIFREKLRESVTDLDSAAGRFEAIANASPDAVVVVDSNSTIIYANSGAAKLFGFETVDDLLGVAITTLMPPKFRSAHLIGMLRFITSGDSRLIGKIVTVPILRRDAAIVRASMSLAAWQSGKGSWYFVAFLRDGDPVVNVEEVTGSAIEEATTTVDLGTPVELGGRVEDESDLVGGS